MSQRPPGRVPACCLCAFYTFLGFLSRVGMRSYAQRDIRIALYRPCAHLSVSHAGVVSKRLNIPSKFLHFLPPAPLFQFYQKSPRLDFRVGHPSTFRQYWYRRGSLSVVTSWNSDAVTPSEDYRCGMKVIDELLSFSWRVTDRLNNSHNAVDCYTPTTTSHAGLNKPPTLFIAHDDGLVQNV